MSGNGPVSVASTRAASTVPTPPVRWRRCHLPGLSLLEVVVVFAIVAMAIVLVLPMVRQLRGDAADIVCRNNLGRIGQAMLHYTMENRGYFPYGWYWRTSDPDDWRPVVNPVLRTNYQIQWMSQIMPYLRATGEPGLASTFQCPIALGVAPHPNSYVMNMIVGITPISEFQVGFLPYAQTKPARMSLMLDEGSALVWDTPIQPHWQNFQGYIVGADLDGQRFWMGARFPQYRYYDPKDVYAMVPPGIFGNNRPVRMDSGSGTRFMNIDPDSGSTFPYQGNLRFRHGDNERCNIVFSDGSVRAFTAIMGKNKIITDHDALRRYFMIHFPPDTPRNPNVP